LREKKLENENDDKRNMNDEEMCMCVNWLVPWFCVEKKHMQRSPKFLSILFLAALCVLKKGKSDISSIPIIVKGNFVLSKFF
jgi:hypothetical protein